MASHDAAHSHLSFSEQPEETRDTQSTSSYLQNERRREFAGACDYARGAHARRLGDMAADALKAFNLSVESL